MKGKNGLIARMLFFELYKVMVNKVTFIRFRGGAIAQSPLPGSAPATAA